MPLRFCDDDDENGDVEATASESGSPRAVKTRRKNRVPASWKVKGSRSSRGSEASNEASNESEGISEADYAAYARFVIASSNIPAAKQSRSRTRTAAAATAAGALAVSLKSRRLLLMTDVEGVYDKTKKLISEIRPAEAEELINDDTIKEGMIPKVKTCINAIEDGVRGVVIIDGRKPHSILFELFSDEGAGTLIRK